MQDEFVCAVYRRPGLGEIGRMVYTGAVLQRAGIQALGRGGKLDHVFRRGRGIELRVLGIYVIAVQQGVKRIRIRIAGDRKALVAQ